MKVVITLTWFLLQVVVDVEGFRQEGSPLSLSYSGSREDRLENLCWQSCKLDILNYI